MTLHGEDVTFIKCQRQILAIRWQDTSGMLYVEVANQTGLSPVMEQTSQLHFRSATVFDVFELCRFCLFQHHDCYHLTNVKLCHCSRLNWLIHGC